MSNTNQTNKKLEILKTYIAENYRSLNAFCKEIGTDTGNLSKILKGERTFDKIVASNLQEKILAKKGFKIFAEIDGDDLANIVWIKEFNIKLSAGPGSEIFEEAIKKYHPIDRYALKQKGLNYESLCIFEVTNDSMFPKYPSGLKVIVNTADIFPIEEGKVYAIRKGNEAFIKRVFREIGTEKYIGKSDNKMFDDIELTKQDDIIGKVVIKLSQDAD